MSVNHNRDMMASQQEKDFTAPHSVMGVDSRPDKGTEDGAALNSAEANEIRDEVVSHLCLPLKTPDKRLLASENISHGVRKRSLPLSPTPDSDSVDGITKQRLVSKCLFASSSISEEIPTRRDTSRCLFGLPSKDEMSLVRKNFDDKIKLEYEDFCERYEIICELKDL